MPRIPNNTLIMAQAPRLRMPSEPINGFCLPYAVKLLAALDKLAVEDELFDLDANVGRLTDKGRMFFGPLSEHMQPFLHVALGVDIFTDDRSTITQAIETMRAFLSVFLPADDEPVSESEIPGGGTMTIARRNEIAWVWGVHERLKKDGINFNPNTFRELGSVSQATGISGEELREFLGLIFDEARRRMFGDKRSGE